MGAAVAHARYGAYAEMNPAGWYAGSEALGQAKLKQIKVRWGIRFLPALGAASLTLAHLLTTAAFRRKAREMSARLENMASVELQADPVPAIIQSFSSRAVGRNPVPRAVAASNWRIARHASGSVATIHR